MTWDEWFFHLWLAGWTEEEIADGYGTTVKRVHALIVMET